MIATQGIDIFSFPLTRRRDAGGQHSGHISAKNAEEVNRGGTEGYRSQTASRYVLKAKRSAQISHDATIIGELSCAECRRLKLRCDKKLPCGSCLRRGCESICPLGDVSRSL